MAGDNGVVPIRGYLINSRSAPPLALFIAFVTYYVLFTHDVHGAVLHRAQHPLLGGMPAIISVAFALTPFAIMAVYSALQAIGPKGTRAQIH